MTALEIFEIVTSLIGGLALFLFGMGTMSDYLGKMTGGLLDKVTGFITKNRFSAFLFGTALTSVVQSSSAVTVLAVGLVNAGVIELGKVIGLIIGANLGTTATAWLLSLNALDGESLIVTLFKPSSFSPFLAIAGVAMQMFARSDKKKNIGGALLGFAVMMIGMNLMSQGVSPLRNAPALENMLLHFSNPLLGYGFAMLFTMLIQSSDATVGIVQAFALSVGLPFASALPLICGAQVGTCITAILSSMGTSRNGKRTAFMNLFYNLFKTLPFMAVFYLLHSLFHFDFMDKYVSAIGIPLAHTSINLIAVAIWLPLANVIVSLVKRIIPFSTEEQEEQKNRLTTLDPLLLKTPSFALGQAEQAILTLADTVRQAFSALLKKEDIPGYENDVKKLCKRSSEYQAQIDKYLTEIAMQELPDANGPTLALLHSANTAFGRIGFITLQIMEQSREMIQAMGQLPEAARREKDVIGEAIGEIIDTTIVSFQKKNPMLSTAVQLYREEITRMSTRLNLRHIQRMHQSEEEHGLSTLLAEAIYAEERTIDCCDIIADALLRYGAMTGANITPSPEDVQQRRAKIEKLFNDKYELLGL